MSKPPARPDCEDNSRTEDDQGALQALRSPHRFDGHGLAIGPKCCQPRPLEVSRVFVPPCTRADVCPGRWLSDLPPSQREGRNPSHQLGVKAANSVPAQNSGFAGLANGFRLFERQDGNFQGTENRRGGDAATPAPIIATCHFFGLAAFAMTSSHFLMSDLSRSIRARREPSLPDSDGVLGLDACCVCRNACPH